jgi:hypothetical protein
MEDLLIRRFAAPDADCYDILRIRFETALRFWGTRPLAKRTHPAFALKGESAS